MAGKTRDGLKISKLVRTILGIPGIEVRGGGNHPYVLDYPGLRPCPVAESTHVKYMVVPWLRQILGLDNRTIYRSLRNGYFEK